MAVACARLLPIGGTSRKYTARDLGKGMMAGKYRREPPSLSPAPTPRALSQSRVVPPPRTGWVGTRVEALGTSAWETKASVVCSISVRNREVSILLWFLRGDVQSLPVRLGRFCVDLPHHGTVLVNQF